MSIFDSFTKRNSLIKTLQFRLKPVYGTETKLQELGLLEKDRARSESWPVVLDILRRLDAQFLEKALTSGDELDWRSLADILAFFNVKNDVLSKDKANAEEASLDKSLAKNKPGTSVKHDALLRKQAEMRKKLVKLLTSQPEYKDLLNPTKAIKMAAQAAENAEEATAVAKFARFTTILVDYFTLKKALFSAEEKKSTIAYRIVQVNLPIYLNNLALLKKFAEAGLDFSDKFTDLTVNAYNKYLIQSQIDTYNHNIGQINQIMQRLYAQHKLPQALKGMPLKLKSLQNQVLGSKDNKTEGFADYSQMREAVCALRNTVLNILDELTPAFQKGVNQALQDKLQEIESLLRESARKVFFQEQDRNCITAIKAFLDAALKLRRLLKDILREGVEEQGNEQQRLLQACADAWEQLEAMPALYNQVRSFLTRKPYTREKIRLFFDCAAFGKGWDANKERDYLLTLFRKQGYYYLGIRRRGAQMDFDKMACDKCSQANCYEKMLYKSFDFVKGMPAVLFSKMVLQKFLEGATEVVLESTLFSKPMVVTRADFEQKYYVDNGKLREKEGEEIKYLKPYLLQTGDEAGYLAAVHQRLELAKRFISSYKAFEFFDMSHLRPTEEYKSWTEFLLHVNEYTYGIRWQSVPEEALQQMVQTGDLFLFQLDNKDSALSRRSEDEQTQLLRGLFSKQNQQTHVLKLLGGVEVYYRPASIKENQRLMHGRGSILVNKKDSTHVALEPALVTNAYKYLNGKSKMLLPEAAELLQAGRITFKRAERDIIKDKRYTEDQMLVHFPISINYRCSSRDYDINRAVRALLKDNAAVNILGVRLGEGNLAEVVLVDQKGQVIFQRVYNEFNEYNYLQALQQKAEERLAAQRNWLQIERIRNLREGYLASLVNEICKLMLKYNAIVVLEDYRRSKRKGGEGEAKQIHMQLALKLLHKLNYLTLKQVPQLEPGGLLNGYQLAPRVESLAGFGNQIGCVFLVPPDRSGAEGKCSGAYAVAMKGLLLLQRINASETIDKVDLLLTKEAWQEFLEERGLSS